MEKVCVIRIRSSIKKSGKIQRILRDLGLDKTNSCVIVNKTPAMVGTLGVAESVITYGELDKETAKILLGKRAMVSNKAAFKWKDGELDGFVEDFFNDKKKLSDMGIKKLFSLHPPVKGFERKGKKTAFTQNGAFGYRSEKINDLLKRMI